MGQYIEMIRDISLLSQTPIIIMSMCIPLLELIMLDCKELLQGHEVNGITPQIIMKLLLDLYHKQ